MSIEENVIEVKRRIEEAAKQSGRRPEDIILVAATKMNDVERVKEAVAAGVDVCGENRVQELREKNELHAYDGKPLHFIGRLQKNKVKYLVGVVDLIQSVDSIDLLEAINKRAESMNVVQDILLEINIGKEDAKGGFEEEKIYEVLEQVGKYKNIFVKGLMAIPPICNEAKENIPYFVAMRKLFVDIASKKYDNVCMDFLSMGMTSDYETAILEGSNMVRVGTGIFGARNYGEK